MTTPGEKTSKRETHPFVVPGLFEPVPAGSKAKPAPTTVEIYRPDERQMVGLLRLLEAVDRGGDPARQILLFERMVASLFTEQRVWDRFEEANIEGAVTWAVYGDFVRSIIQHFYPNAQQAGPAEPATRRRASRARR